MRIALTRQRKRFNQAKHALALEADTDVEVHGRLLWNAEFLPHRRAMHFAQPRMERFQIDAVVDDMELRLRSAEMRADFIPDHARIADDGTQARAREYTPLCGEDVAMIGIERETGPGERAEGRAAVAQPLRVHPVTGAVDVATRNAFVRLHDIEGTAGDLTAHRTCEAPAAPRGADVNGSQRTTLPGSPIHVRAITVTATP